MTTADRPASLLGALLAAGVLAAGCGGADTHQARIHLDGRDPCAVVPRQDYARFSMTGPGKPYDHDIYADAPACAWEDTEVGFFEIILVTEKGIGMWHEPRRDYFETAETDPIGGRPALTVHLPGVSSACMVAVDVTDGQHLVAHAGGVREAGATTACDYARDLAVSAMGTLAPPVL